MQDALDALASAIAELKQARETLPEDLAADLDEVIAQAEALLVSLRTKAPDVPR